MVRVHSYRPLIFVEYSPYEYSPYCGQCVTCQFFLYPFQIYLFMFYASRSKKGDKITL